MVHIPTIAVRAAEIKPNARVHGTFLVRRKIRGVGKTGKPWLQLILGDKTGTIDARVWENADSLDAHISENSVVDVEGQSVQFMDHVQLKVSRLTINEGKFDPSDFLPESAQSPERLRAGLLAQGDLLREPWLRKLYERYLNDGAWLPKFLRAPAAKNVHHAYLGGLAEHTLSMMSLARRMGEHYVAAGVQPLNVDVLVLGAFLHDTGKVEEISADVGFAYTTPGRLIGHITLGLDRLDAAVRAMPNFPTDLHMHLRHLILSHHGEYEYGSPRRPKTIEGLLLHFVDNIDARVAIFSQAIAQQSGNDQDWTGLEPTLGRHIFRRPIDTGKPPHDD